MNSGYLPDFLPRVYHTCMKIIRPERENVRSVELTERGELELLEMALACLTAATAKAADAEVHCAVNIARSIVGNAVDAVACAGDSDARTRRSGFRLIQ